MSDSYWARVYNNAVINLAISGQWYYLPFNTERWDTDSIHSPTYPERLTATRSGLYLITGHARFAGNPNGYRSLQIHHSVVGTIAWQHLPAVADSITVVSVATLYYLNAGEYVRLAAQQTSGGPLNVDVAANYSPEFAMAYVGSLYA